MKKTMSSLESLEKIGRIPIISEFNKDLMISDTYSEAYDIIEKDLNDLKAYKDIGKELGINLVLLFKALKAKQSGLRYFDKYDAKVNGIKEGWYVNMMLYGWVRVEDFVKGALTTEELEDE